MGHTSSERIEMKNRMLDAGLDNLLLKVAQAFPMLKFSEPDIVDSRDFAIEANTGNINVKVFIAVTKSLKEDIQIELRARNSEQKEWLRKHFNKLGTIGILRRDNPFLPETWKGAKNKAYNYKIAIERVKLLLEIVYADDRSKLSLGAINLL